MWYCSNYLYFIISFVKIFLWLIYKKNIFIYNPTSVSLSMRLFLQNMNEHGPLQLLFYCFFHHISYLCGSLRSIGSSLSSRLSDVFLVISAFWMLNSLNFPPWLFSKHFNCHFPIVNNSSLVIYLRVKASVLGKIHPLCRIRNYFRQLMWALEYIPWGYRTNNICRLNAENSSNDFNKIRCIFPLS